MSARLTDTGFANRQLISALLRRYELRIALYEVGASAEALLNLLDKNAEAARGLGASKQSHGARLATGDFEGGCAGSGVADANSHAVSEKELLECVKLLPHLFERLDAGIRHGLFSCKADQEASEASELAHSLSGGAK